MGLLDDLKKQADALKAQDIDKTESLRATAVAVDHSLRRTFLYLNDLGKQLNVVQMPSPFTFDLPTRGQDRRARHQGLLLRLPLEALHRQGLLRRGAGRPIAAASDKVLTIKKGPDDMEKFRDILWQSNIEHKSEQFRNERKVITHEVFKVRVRLPRAGARSRATTRPAS